MRNYNATVIFFVLFATFPLKISSDITVAVASNMQYAMEEIKVAYKNTYETSILPVYNASGKLAMQIPHGAPFDVFVSADMNWPESLYIWKFSPAKPIHYASGTIVLWTKKDIDLGQGIQILQDPSIKTIAIGDLSLTVYGPEAKKALENASLWSSISSKLVFGNNISQVAHYISSGAADIGFAAKSTVLSPEMKSVGKWVDLDSSLCKPIPQGMVKLSHGMKYHSAETELFFKFMSSTMVKTILTKYGYVTL